MALIETLVADIRRGTLFSDRQLADVLKMGSRAERFSACKELAMALASNGGRRQSRLLAQRAFALWIGEPGFVDEYLDLLRADHDAEGIRKVSKRAGMWMADRGNLMEALRYFNLHHYAYQSTGQGDRYEYDLDILKAVEQLARTGYAHLPPREKIEIEQGRLLRVAYLVYGATHTNSVLVRLLTDFSRYHDRELFECLFFSPDANLLPSRPINCELLRAAGGELIAVDSADEKVCLIETEKMLRDCQPDIVVSVAALADYRQYYLFCCCPTAARIALCYGPPAQYVPPTADFVISATWHPLIDSPCDGTVVEIQATLPERPTLSDGLPEGIAIPDEAVVLMAAGRSEKFLDREYWQAIFDVLETHPDTYFVAFGLTDLPPFLGELLKSDIKRRVIILGWLVDYHGLLARANIVIDTYPSGGGLTIMDSMSYGIPVVSFSNDFLRPFDQLNWSLADEVIGMQELIIPRGDFGEFKRRLGELIEKPALRERLGSECKARITQTRGKPERMIRRMEEHYVEVARRIQGQERKAIDNIQPILRKFYLGFW